MYTTKLADELHIKLLNRTNPNRAFIVGIDGLGGAGKTTFVHKLSSKLKHIGKVVCIHLDNHIVERKKRYHTGFEEWYEYYYLQWDIEMLETEMFKKLYSSYYEITLPYYQKDTDELMNKKIFTPPDTIVLIEGVFLQRKEWKPYYDFTIFVDCPEEIRHKRAIKRDTYIGDEQARLNKYQNRYWPAEKYYLEKLNPIEIADKIYRSN